MIDQIADAMESDRRLRVFLESPRVSAQRKNEIIQKAFGGQLPRNFVRFLQALVNHRRQMLIPAIAHEYHDLVDRVEGRVHASVTVVARAGGSRPGARHEPALADARQGSRSALPREPSHSRRRGRPRRRHRARRVGSSTAGDAPGKNDEVVPGSRCEGRATAGRAPLRVPGPSTEPLEPSYI